MPDPLAHSRNMLEPIYRNEPLPTFWWLFPWAYIGYLRRNLRYMEMIAQLDARIIRRQDERIKELNDGIERLAEIVNRARDLSDRE